MGRLRLHALVVLPACILGIVASPARAQERQETPETQESQESPDDGPGATLGWSEMGTGGRRVPLGRTDTQSAITDSTRDAVEIRAGDLRLSLGMLLSGLLDVGVAPPQSNDNGFALTDARIAFDGGIGQWWGYLLQVDFARSRPLLDLRLTFQPHEALRIQAGRFKVPFSGELMVAAADLDMNERAQAVVALAPNRSVGVEIGGGVNDRLFFYRLGIYNGNADLTNDDDNFLLAARTGTELPLVGDDVALTLAANAAWSRDSLVTLPFRVMPFEGERLLLGADARLVLGPVHLASEALYGRLTPVAASDFELWGYHVTAGWLVVPWFQVLLRWDSFYRGDLDVQRDLLIPSLSFVLPDHPQLQSQLDVQIPVRDGDQTRVILSVTVAF